VSQFNGHDTASNRFWWWWNEGFIQIELNVQYVANMVDIFKTSSVPHATCVMTIVLWHVSHIMWPFPSSNFILSYFILSNFISNFSYCIFLFIFCKWFIFIILNLYFLIKLFFYISSLWITFWVKIWILSHKLWVISLSNKSEPLVWLSLLTKFLAPNSNQQNMRNGYLYTTTNMFARMWCWWPISYRQYVMLGTWNVSRWH